MNKIRKIKQSIKTNYQLYRTYWTFRLYFLKIFRRNTIIVYQMGKVGSSTIVATLKNLKLNKAIYDVHTLTEKGISEKEQMAREMCNNSSTTYFPRASHLLTSRFLLKEMNEGLGRRNWKIVTLVREPISVNISTFFQIIDYRLPDFNDRYLSGEVTIENAIKVFLQNHDHVSPLTWFDKELNSVLGIDIFAIDFPQSKGYKIYPTKLGDLLILKLECINDCKDKAFKEFLGIDYFNLFNANISKEKEYSSAYIKFKKSIVLTESYIDKMYSSKYARHFYSEEEIESFKVRWRQQSD